MIITIIIVSNFLIRQECLLRCKQRELLKEIVKQYNNTFCKQIIWALQGPNYELLNLKIIISVKGWSCIFYQLLLLFLNLYTG